MVLDEDELILGRFQDIRKVTRKILQYIYIYIFRIAEFFVESFPSSLIGLQLKCTRRNSDILAALIYNERPGGKALQMYFLSEACESLQSKCSCLTPPASRSG